MQVCEWRLVRGTSFHVSLKGVARHRLSDHICVSEISLIDGDQPHGRNWRPADLRWREHGDWAATWGFREGRRRGGASRGVLVLLSRVVML